MQDNARAAQEADSASVRGAKAAREYRGGEGD